MAALWGTAFGACGEGYLRFSYANSVDNISAQPWNRSAPSSPEFLITQIASRLGPQSQMGSPSSSSILRNSSRPRAIDKSPGCSPSTGGSGIRISLTQGGSCGSDRTDFLALTYNPAP